MKLNYAIVILKLAHFQLPVTNILPFIRVMAGNLLPWRILPKLYHRSVFKSKNSRDEREGFASDDPPATTIPLRPLIRTFVHAC